MSEWVKLIFEEPIYDMVHFITNDWLGDIYEFAVDEIQANISADSWEEFDIGDKFNYMGEMIKNELNRIETSEEDQEIISIYYNEMIKEFVRNL